MKIFLNWKSILKIYKKYLKNIIYVFSFKKFIYNNNRLNDS